MKSQGGNLKFYKVKEVAEILKVKPMVVYRWIKEGRIESVRINTTIRVTEEQLEALTKPKNPNVILRKKEEQ